MEFTKLIIKESSACSAWEYIRLSLIAEEEIKIGAAGVNSETVLTNRRLGEGKGREGRKKGSKDESFESRLYCPERLNRAEILLKKCH